MNYQWAVIGAGPAGIAAVGKLIDHGVSSKEIAWLDPEFKVGDFGTRWHNVPSNTKVKLFIDFLNAAQSFNFKNAPSDLAIHKLPQDKTCYLGAMGAALHWVTDELKKEVHWIEATAETLTHTNRSWKISYNHSSISAKQVILAIGAEAKNLSLPAKTIISLQDAMDSERIKDHIDSHDTIAVFGSSHSAILAIRNLVEKNVNVINFFQYPLRYAVYLEDWILFDDSGLKGPTAEWARENIDGVLPKNLTRIHSTQENIEHYFPQCNKVVYAVGFERRSLPVIENLGSLQYIEQCGIIAPGLFGLGIAFPEAKLNPFGLLEYRVGLWKFMEYLQRIMPVWLKYSP